MSDTNTVHNGQHRLAFGEHPPESRYANDVQTAANKAYTVPVPGGWLLYTRFHSCRARLLESSGWTQEQAEVVARVIDGDIVL